MSDTIKLTINGEMQSFDEQLTVSELLQRLELIGKNLFVEYNKEPLHRDMYNETRIQSGDNIEIVTMMAGG